MIFSSYYLFWERYYWYYIYRYMKYKMKAKFGPTWVMIVNFWQFFLLFFHYIIYLGKVTIVTLYITTLKVSTVLLWSDPTPPIRLLLLRNCCTILTLPIESEITDWFWCSRCLNDHIDLPNMIGSFASGVTASMVAKSGTKKIFHYCG